MFTAVRLAGYTFGVFFVIATFRPLVGRFGIDFFQENGPVEWIELAILLAVTAIFLLAARRTPRFRQLFILLACPAVLAQFREMDAILDPAVPWLGWKIGYAVLIAGALYARRHWAALRAQAAEFVATRACGILWVGFLIAVPIAQLVGHGPLLRLGLGDDYSFAYKQMIEEILEVLGYLVIAIAGVEAALQLRAPARAAGASPTVLAFPYERRPRPAPSSQRPVSKQDAV